MAAAPTPPSSTFKGLTCKFTKWQYCVLAEGQTVMVTVTRKVFASLCATKSGTVTLKEYLHSKGWKTSQMEQLCTKDWQHMLTKDLMNSEFDISFACKLLNKAFTEVYNKLSENCRESILELRKKKNKLSHCFYQQCLQHLNLENEVNKLLQLFTDIYMGVGVAIELDFSDSIENTKKNLEKICRSSCSEDYDVYKDREKNFKDSLPHILISKGQEELVNYYKRLNVLNPCTWMLGKGLEMFSESSYDIEKIYTPLWVEDFRDYEIDVKELFKTEVCVRESSVVPGALLMYGLAGCGKTSLCRYILNTWSKLEDKKIEGIDNFDLVILVEPRLLQGRNLKEYLSDTLSKTYKLITDAKNVAKIYVSVENDVIETLPDLYVLFIIDGFDENCEDASKILEDINELGPNHRIIVTTRPEFLSKVDEDLKDMDIDYLTVKICDFDDKKRKEFIAKVFDVALEEKTECKRIEERGRFSEYVKGRERILGEHLNLPLTLALLIFLWIDRVEDSVMEEQILSEITSCTTLFYQLSKLCQKKLIQSLKMDDHKIDELLLLIGEMAWKCLRSDEVYINKENLQEIVDKCEKLGDNKIRMLSAFLMCEYVKNSDSQEGEYFKSSDSEDEYFYSFLHKTQMEYLAAQFLVRQNLKEIIEVHDWERFQQVIIFLMGHMTLLGQASRKNLEDILELVKKSEVYEGSYDFWWKFLVEADNEKEVREIIAWEHLPTDSWLLMETGERHMVVPGLELLMSTPAKINSLKIEVDSHVDPYAIKNLLVVMEDLAVKLKGRYSGTNPIQVELHFRHHYTGKSKCEPHLDELLHTLHPWGHLTSLTGSLGEQKGWQKVLEHSYNLETLQLRLCSVGAVTNLSVSLQKIFKDISKLCVTLDFPSNEVDPSHLPRLSISGDLEVTIPGICDENKEWVKAVVKNVSWHKGGPTRQGCSHLILDKSQLTSGAVKDLIINLTHVVTEQLSVETTCYITDKDKMSIATLASQRHINVKWI